MPVFVSPAGVHALCDSKHGECATARVCAKHEILFGLSQHSTRSIEDVAAATPSSLKFYQAYILKDRQKTLSLIRRAVQAGYQGIFLTVDSVRFGYREPDARNGFNALPPPHRLVNYDEPSGVVSNNKSSNTLDQTYNSQEKKSWDQNSEQMFEQDVSWDDVSWIKRELLPSGIPLVIKGIMTAEDALRAIESGADGIMVSNHGGRQLDGCLASIDALPEIAVAVAGRIPIWLDSGVRRGTDVLKALGTHCIEVIDLKTVILCIASLGNSTQ
jgi:(S)-2-hydroxy-acid oxidase